MSGPRRRLLTPHWLKLHAAVLLVVAGFLALGWWQAIRAGEGNARSYGYAAEWPTFALIVLFLWVRAMRTELKGLVAGAADTAAGQPELPSALRERELVVQDVIAADEADDPDLAAYNRYLAELNQQHAERRRP